MYHNSIKKKTCLKIKDYKTTYISIIQIKNQNIVSPLKITLFFKIICSSQYKRTTCFAWCVNFLLTFICFLSLYVRSILLHISLVYFLILCDNLCLSTAEINLSIYTYIYILNILLIMP